MPKRWCTCNGCPHCGKSCRDLYDKDAAPGLRCPACQAHATSKRNARPGSTRRGLGWAFTARKAKDRNYQEATTCQCTGCPQHRGPCGAAFTMDNPKTAGHVTPRSRGGGSGPILAVCRRCNSSDGGRLAHER